MRIIAIAVLLAALAGCTAKPSLEDPPVSGIELELEKFFEGELVAYGQVQDLFGTVRDRFRVEIEGSWDGEVLTLIEDFTYADGHTEQRIWTLRQTGPESWEGTAPGVVGVATGQERGDTFNWTYTIDLPLREGSRVVSFDDWMWQLSEDRLLNIAYMRKFGLDLAKVVIVFEKRG
jgi:hypothetical protein